MKQSSEHFSAETIDEQIEQITNKSGQHQPSESHTIDAQDATLVQNLQTLAHNEAELLTEIRERLANAYEESIADTPLQPIQFQAYAEKKRPVKRRMVQILSGLVAALIIGSVLTILIGNNSYLSHPTSPSPASDYYSLANGHLIRTDAKNGTVLWNYTIASSQPNPSADLTTKLIENTLGASFVVQGNTIYIVNSTNEYAVNNINGTLLWSKNYAGKFPAGEPRIVGNKFYVINGKTHQMDAFTLSNAQLTQSYNIPLSNIPPNSLPLTIISNNILYAWNNSTICALSLANHQLLWTQNITGITPIDVDLSGNSAHIIDNTIYIERSPNAQSNEVSILALNALTGKKIGQTSLFVSDSASFTAVDSVVYYEVGNAYHYIIHAYNIQTGKEIWQKDLNGTALKMFTINNQMVSVITKNNAKNDKHMGLINEIVTLDAKSGTLKWQYSEPQTDNINAKYILTLGAASLPNYTIIILRSDGQDPRTGGIFASQAGQGRNALYFVRVSKTNTQTDIITPEGKVIHQTYQN
jgi:outer membrane protein assembly factor BamB